MMPKIETIADRILFCIKANTNAKKKEITIKEISLLLKEDSKKVAYWVEFFENLNIAGVAYPTNIFASPKIRLLVDIEKIESTDSKSRAYDKKRKLEMEYEIKTDKLPASVKIWSYPSEDVPLYEITLPKLGPGTRILLSGLMDELAKRTPIVIEDATDLKKIMEIRQEYLSSLVNFLKEKMPEEKLEALEVLASILLHQMYGLGEVEAILGDDYLEEIAINGSNEPISVYHKNFGWVKTFMHLKTEDEIFNLSSQIGRKSGQQINFLNPIMDAHLLTGERVASTIYPISAHGDTITIRKFAKKPWTITQFLSKEISLLSKEMAAFIWMAMQFELNIIVAGGTGSGKTSFLNVLCSFMQPKNRVISVEDTRELVLPDTLHWNWVPMVSKNSNPEGKGGVTMLDLIVAALRMRPDRIVVGEIRRKEQAQALFEAMHTGHSVYATMHADTTEQVGRRLLEPPIEVPQTELASLHLIIVQFRDRKTGKRRTREMAEIVDSKEGIELNHLFRWHPRTDTFEKVNESTRIYEDLSLHTGLTVSEIESDLKKKEEVLQWLMDGKVDDVNQIGEVMRIYYSSNDFLFKCIKKNMGLKAVLEQFSGVAKSDKEKKEKAQKPASAGKKQKKKSTKKKLRKALLAKTEKTNAAKAKKGRIKKAKRKNPNAKSIKKKKRRPQTLKNKTRRISTGKEKKTRAPAKKTKKKIPQKKGKKPEKKR